MDGEFACGKLTAKSAAHAARARVLVNLTDSKIICVAGAEVAKLFLTFIRKNGESEIVGRVFQQSLDGACTRN